VLVVSPRPPAPYRRVLAAIDLTDASHDVVQLACRMCAPGGTIELVHATRTPFAPWLSMDAELRAEAEEHLAHFRAELGEGPFRTHVVVGDAAAAVIAAAAAVEADLIVLGTHGRTALGCVLLGGVALEVAMDAPCDVLVASALRATFGPA
jgi:nucleotide-binding universal stress UspA family protein